MKTKQRRVTQEIRLPIAQAQELDRRAHRLGLTLEEYIEYGLIRSADDRWNAQDAIEAIEAERARPAKGRE